MKKLFLIFLFGSIFALEVDKLVIKNPKTAAHMELSVSDEGTPLITFFDTNNVVRLSIEGGERPSIFLKNKTGQTISSWVVLQDGGVGLGFAEKEGYARCIIRGGEQPGLAFFSNQVEPLATLGILEGVPHLMISGQTGNEAVFIHGGSPTGVMVIDEDGKMKIFISKHGVFQGKDEETPNKKEKLFSKEDALSLFPLLPKR